MTKNSRNPPGREQRNRRKQAGGTLWRRALIVAAGLVLGLNLYRWNASALAGNALPMPFGTGAAVVLSGSMDPALKVNDLVLVRQKPRYEVGDIVVYQSGNTLIVHRIIARDGNQIITRGDANSAADAPIDAGAVKGAVAARLPFAGAAVNLLKSPAAAVLLLAGAGVLLERSFQAEKQADEESLDALKEEIRRLKAELPPGEQGDTDEKAR